MGSSISSLGIGSGVLTADVIDQLKAADESRIIKPIENKITINNQKQDAEELLTSLMKTFKASASALSYDTIFDNKTVDVNGNAEVSVEAGATVESFTLETTTLAKKDITNFGEFSSKTSALVGTGESGVLNLTINGTTYGIAYDDTTTLEDLAQSITDEAGTDISASILETGTGVYSLVLSSKTTGLDQAITIEDTDDGSVGTGTLDGMFDAYVAGTNPNGYQKIQNAADSEFLYNGIAVTRSTNDISDLILGVNIKLKEEGDISSVDISQDTEEITGELQQFTDSYNTLITNLHDMTLKDKETGAEGVFNSNSFVKSISRELSQIITSISGSNESLVNYGIELDRYGTMSFDKSVIDSKLEDDPDAVKLFFTGGTDSNGNEVAGIFETLDSKLKDYTGYGKLLSNFKTDLETEGTNLSKSHLSATASLESRYAIMTKRFTAYDAMISKINAQFSSLQMIINADSNS
jgi:flagellar hook-associated protein 2